MKVHLYDSTEAATWYKATRIYLPRCSECGERSPIRTADVPLPPGLVGVALSCGRCRGRNRISVEDLKNCETLGVTCPKCLDGQMLWNEGFIKIWQVALAIGALAPHVEPGSNIGFGFTCPDCGTLVNAAINATRDASKP